jgi:hypothetical protein
MGTSVIRERKGKPEAGTDFIALPCSSSSRIGVAVVRRGQFVTCREKSEKIT